MYLRDQLATLYTFLERIMTRRFAIGMMYALGAINTLVYGAHIKGALTGLPVVLVEAISLGAVVCVVVLKTTQPSVVPTGFRWYPRLPDITYAALPNGGLSAEFDCSACATVTFTATNLSSIPQSVRVHHVAVGASHNIFTGCQDPGVGQTHVVSTMQSDHIRIEVDTPWMEIRNIRFSFGRELPDNQWY